MVNVLSSSSSMPITAPCAGGGGVGGEKKAVNRQATSHFTFHFYPHALHMFLHPPWIENYLWSISAAQLFLPHKLYILLLYHPALWVTQCFSPPLSLLHSLSHSNIQVKPFGTWERKGKGRRAKEEEGMDGWRETHQGAAASSQRYGLLDSWGICS